MMSLPRAALGLSVVVLAWGLNYPIVTLGLSYSPPIWLAFFRALSAFLAMMLLLRGLGVKAPLSSKQKAIAAMFGIPGSVLFFGFWLLGSTTVSPGVSSVLVMTFPLWILFLSVPILGDRPSPKKVGAALLGFVGTALASNALLQGTGSDALAMVELVAAGFGFGLLNVGMKKFFRGQEMLRANVWQLGASLIPLAVWASFTSPIQSVQWSLGLAFSVFWIGVLGTAVAFVLWFTLLSQYNAASLGSYLFMIVVVALVSSFLAFGEPVDVIQAGGVALIVASIYLVSKNDRHMHRPSTADYAKGGPIEDMPPNKTRGGL